jgi:hypothetical protein
MTTTHAVMIVTQKKHNLISNEHQTMISFSLLLTCMNVFIYHFDSFFVACSQITIAHHQ